MDTQVTAFFWDGSASERSKLLGKPHELTVERAVAQPILLWCPSHEAELPPRLWSQGDLVMELTATASLPCSTVGPTFGTISSSGGTNPLKGRILHFHD